MTPAAFAVDLVNLTDLADLAVDLTDSAADLTDLAVDLAVLADRRDRADLPGDRASLAVHLDDLPLTSPTSPICSRPLRHPPGP